MKIVKVSEEVVVAYFKAPLQELSGDNEKKSPLKELVTKPRFGPYSSPTYSVLFNVLTIIIYVLMNEFYLFTALILYTN
jgi:hypothetical protein